MAQRAGSSVQPNSALASEARTRAAGKSLGVCGAGGVRLNTQPCQLLRALVGRSIPGTFLLSGAGTWPEP